jgi:hypothetical protein
MGNIVPDHGLLARDLANACHVRLQSKKVFDKRGWANAPTGPYRGRTAKRIFEPQVLGRARNTANRCELRKARHYTRCRARGSRAAVEFNPYAQTRLP